MISSAILSRVKTDFFAILVPGTFVSGVIGAVYMALTQENPNITIEKHIKFFLGALKDYWPLSILLIIIGYLVGNLIRAIRVDYADKLNKNIFSKITRSGSKKMLYESVFPYPVMLEKIRNELVECNLVHGVELPKRDFLYDVYQYWKMMICSELTEVFCYIHNLESRVRLFSGMFWAGFLGIIGSIVIFIGCIVSPDIIGVVWLKFNVYLLILSGIISFMFGKSIRRVRGEEVRSVFNAYLVLHERKYDLSVKPESD